MHLYLFPLHNYFLYARKTNPHFNQIEILSYEDLMNVSNEWKTNDMSKNKLKASSTIIYHPINK